MWDKVVEKAINTEIKTSLQPSSRTREINSRCPKNHRPLAKKNKDNAHKKHQDGDKDKDKTKSHNLSFINSQPQTQVSKNNKRQGSCQKGYLVTEVNTNEVAKKNKDKVKDLSHIKCYTCKQKGYYANKCPKKPKN